MSAIDLGQMVAAVRTLGRGQLARYGGSGTSETEKFERELRSFIGVEHALAVNSGTSALICALAGLGVGPGDEVLVPAYTWVSSAAAAVALGAVPVLVEIDESLTMDPADLERKITSRSRAIIPVHMLNLVCDMAKIMKIADRHSLVVVEDACQAIGATYRGQRVGSIGDAAAFSFNQHKNIRSGEGGAVVTNNERVHARAAMYHDVGSYTRSERLEHEEPLFVGMNLRMPELSSAILRPQLKRLDRRLAKRQTRRAMMIEALITRSDLTISPHHDPDSAIGLSVWFEDPAAAQRFASARGVNRLIETGRHVYTNWQSILARRTFDDRVDPWRDSDVSYTADSCPRTIEILERTCSVSLDPDLPLSIMRKVAGSIASARTR